MSVVHVTDQSFDQEVLKFEGVCLVDFWAPWCGPCQMLGPVIEELSEIFNDPKVKICKIDIDENPETANKFQIMSIPTILIFKNGKTMEQETGVKEKEEIGFMIKKYLD